MSTPPTLTFVRDKIIQPALVAINNYSLAAKQLVLAVGQGESLYKNTRQIASYGPPIIYGPARSYFQMEKATHDDLWKNYLGYPKRQTLLDGLRKISDHPGDVEELVNNQVYAAAMCRIFFLRVPAALPAANDWTGIAEYWKKFYNTIHGKGTVNEFLVKIKPVMELYK